MPETTLNRLELPPELSGPYARAAMDALEASNAVNASGIVHSLSVCMSNVLWPIAWHLKRGTDWVNRHPIVIVYLDKLADLAGAYVMDGPEVLRAYSAVQSISKGEFYA